MDPHGKGGSKRNLSMVAQLDLDRMCGVLLETGSGGRCMRTIDCKAHTQQVRGPPLLSLQYNAPCRAWQEAGAPSATWITRDHACRALWSGWWQD